MLTKNNWLQSNLKDRLIDKTVDLQLSINLYSFYDMPFDKATDYTCNEIYKEHKKLYLALSGGLDSEYALRAFHRNNISIQPIIVCCGNEKENEYAYQVCEELKIVPIVISVTEKQFLLYFLECIYKKLDGVGYNSTQLLFAQEYASKNNGVIIAGEHFIYDNESMIDEKYFIAYEWDFYGDCNFGGNIINFFAYTPEIVYSMFPKVHTTWEIYRATLYGIPLRKKIKATYSKSLDTILKNLSNRPRSNKTELCLSKSQCLDIFEKYRYEYSF